MGITASQNQFECTPAVPARFIGEFASLAALEAAHPTAPAGSYAVVNQVGDDLIYYYSVTDGAWFTQAGGPGSTPGINAVLTVDDTVTTKDQIFELSATEFLKINRATQTIEFWDTAVDAVNPTTSWNKSFFNGKSTDNGTVISWDIESGSFGIILGTDEIVFNLSGFYYNGVFFGWPSGATSTIATQSYVDNKVAGLLDLRGNHDASGNAFPTTGGSGTSGAILKGDLWLVSVAGVLNGVAVNIGDSFYAKTDSPTSSDWSILESNLGYVAENAANKTDNMTGNESNSTKYLSAKGIYDYLIGMTWLTDTIFGTWINARTAKTTPVDADMVPLMDSADSNKTKKLSWANIKATLATAFYLDATSSIQTQLNAKQPKTIKAGYTQLTGVTGTQVLTSLLIPANTYASIDGIEILMTPNKSVTASAITFGIYHDTSLNGVTNAIATGVNLTTSQRVGYIHRPLVLDGTTLRNLMPVSATSLVPIAGNTVGATTTFNPTVDNYITITVNPTVSSEVCGFNQLVIRLL